MRAARATGPAALLLLLAGAAAGCVGSAQHRGEPLAGWPPPSGPRPVVVNLVAVESARQQGNVTGGVADAVKDMQAGVRRAFDSCPCFRMEDVGSKPWDRRVVLSALTLQKDKSGSDLSAFICGFTLLTWPAHITFDIQLTATVYDAEGNTLGEFFEQGDETLYIMSWLLLPAMPFYTTAGAYQDECYELTRRIILRARGAGAL